MGMGDKTRHETKGGSHFHFTKGNKEIQVT